MSNRVSQKIYICSVPLSPRAWRFRIQSNGRYSLRSFTVETNSFQEEFVDLEPSGVTNLGTESPGSLELTLSLSEAHD